MNTQLSQSAVENKLIILFAGFFLNFFASLRLVFLLAVLQKSGEPLVIIVFKGEGHQIE